MPVLKENCATSGDPVCDPKGTGFQNHVGDQIKANGIVAYCDSWYMFEEPGKLTPWTSFSKRSKENLCHQLTRMQQTKDGSLKEKLQRRRHGVSRTIVHSDRTN